MMANKYNLTEQKVLNKLKIPDFRYMTKDKVVKFVGMMPHMDPSVAKEAIAKFPEFKDMALQMTEALKEMVDKAFKSANESQQYFYDACNKVLDSLDTELKDDEIDAAERDRIENKMIQIINLIGQKDTEHKLFIANIIKNAVMGISTLALGAIAVLGISIALPSYPNDDNDENDYSI